MQQRIPTNAVAKNNIVAKELPTKQTVAQFLLSIWCKRIDMEDFYNPSNLLLLRNLLNPENSDSEPEIDDRVPSTTITSKAAASKPPSQSSPQESYSQSTTDPQTIEEWEEREALLVANELEHRISPEYNIIYKQTVSPEDIYLPLSNKTPATTSCEEICIEIQLPDETVDIDQMALDVRDTGVDLQTPVYRLNVPFPQPIDPDHGKAEWDNARKLLTLTLRTKEKWNLHPNPLFSLKSK